jgi:ABC-2 type transport system permease protein
MLTRARAIFIRDARLAVSYRLSFALQWLGVAAGAVTLWFTGRLVAPSAEFGPSGTYFAYALVNVAFLQLESAALTGCERVIRNDQVYGTLETILATPTSLAVVAIGSTAWAFAFAFIQIACYLGFGALLGLRLEHVQPLVLGAFVLLAVGATVPLGIASAATVMVFKQGAPLQFLFARLTPILAGVLFPIALLPGWLQGVSWFLPMTHVLGGIRGAVNGVPFAQLLPDAVWLAAAACALLPIALVAFRVAVARAKFDGTLGHY